MRFQELSPRTSKGRPLMNREAATHLEPPRVLVINSSHEMAKEITMELALSLPGCAITYAPSLDIAQFVLSRNSFSLVVSSSILPDGHIARLRRFLEELTAPPTLVVVGQAKSAQRLQLGSVYRIQSVQRAQARPVRRVPPRLEAVRNLGADLRNDLNNPLQEIVAMVFVAQASKSSPTTNEEALAAIDRAAKNLASVVQSIESKIQNVMGG